MPERLGSDPPPAVTAALGRRRRDRVPLTAATLDLDGVERFNDQYGHGAGDRLLEGAAAAWTSRRRTVDQPART
jgi:diguanylate cyclase (GGDEF)-like protein